ncbi:MAG TPA: right-handed parallel beta-helix repeat-containing protein [bacterium]|nr:right-handed parallel beta-helix repeat-containing protein [bacterium]
MKHRNRHHHGIFQLVISGLILIGLTSASAATRRVPSEYPTIKDAVDASDHGDTVLIADGTYSGNGNRNINMRYKNIVVTSENGAGTCIVDCAGGNFGFVLTIGSIQGLTIQNADGSGQGYGVLFDMGGGRLLDCVIRDCRVGIYGNYASGVEIVGCRIAGNEYEGAISVSGDMKLFNCEIDHGGDYAVWNRDIAWMELNNCRVTGTVFTQAATELYLNHCTIIGDVEAYMESMVELTHCIQRDGGIGYDATSGYSVTYSNTEIPYTGEGNISEDPLFVTGPGGDYYLSQVAAGQAGDSPCVDAGAADAAAVCFTPFTGQYCLDTLTTRTDAVEDSGVVDMGFHYATDIEPPATPTPGPSPTPTVTPEPTVTPTPTPGDEGVVLRLSDDVFTGGERFLLEADCTVPAAGSYDLYVMLDIYGLYYFYPAWTEALNHARIDIDAGLTRTETILDFTWPDGDLGSAAIFIWGLMTQPDSWELVGNFDQAYFEYTSQD